MKYLIFLSGENLELAKEEVLALAGKKKCKQHNNIIIVDSEDFNYKRLAYAHKVCQHIFTCKGIHLKKVIIRNDWQKYYQKNFAVNTYKTKLTGLELANIMWNKLKNPKVDLLYAKTKFEFFEIENKVYCGLQLWENVEDFNFRKAHNRPGFSPVSLHPKLARTLVNLSRVKNKMLDPFCGTGGILIEAGLMKIKTIGTDIDKEMLKKAKKNLNYFKLNCLLEQKDAREVNYKVDAIVTDPPYGKSSSLKNTEMKKLIMDFLKNAYKILPKKSYLIMMLPNNLKIKSKFKIKNKIDFFIHKSLTRTIYIMLK
ncbi:MAG: methyltransferase domain-containing protein [Nanoarchaeota archaeon]|nr:methyltransferase domain-containing protein [Nanoarchaeota archaeon]MBU4352028.1 methyltransferase domain-containing protein [Nanoarchaeota archaeon]MBU4456511.1 methyltransferase domain-containing protein [Nanoarchaeota archaeon]MCG2719313.1 methyltransferase domain-containing protein [Nanoarchaeota archaeon]